MVRRGIEKFDIAWKDEIKKREIGFLDKCGNEKSLAEFWLGD